VVPSAGASRYLQRASSIPSLPGGDGSAQHIFVPDDLDLDGDCLEGKRENYQVCSVQYYVQQLCTVQ